MQPKTFLTLTQVHVHESTIRRTLNYNGVCGGKVGRKKELVFFKNVAVCLKIAWINQKTIGGKNVDGWDQNSLNEKG